MIFEFNKVTPGLNGKKGLIRSHWRSQASIKDAIHWLILEKKLPRLIGKVKMTYIRCYSGKPMDWDNLAASMKYWKDGLVKSTVIQDDSPNFIPEQPRLFQNKVKRGMEKTIIILEKWEGKDEKRREELLTRLEKRLDISGLL
jgi:hypothetical protein